MSEETVSTEQKPISDNARANFERLERSRDEANNRAQKAELEAALLKQRMDDIEARNRPKEEDPLDKDDNYADPKSVKASQALMEKRMKKEAEEIAKRTYSELKNADKQENHITYLKQEFSDFNTVMTEKNVVSLEQSNPEFLQSLLHVKDDYERKKLCYQYLKRHTSQPEAEKQSIKERVEQNAHNPYMIATGSGVQSAHPSAVDFDVSSKSARATAYAKLKAAQKRPIGGAQRADPYPQ